MKIILQQAKGFWLVGGHYLGLPGPPPLLIFSPPSFLVHRWSVIAIDWRLLIIPPGATKGIMGQMNAAGVEKIKKCVEAKLILLRKDMGLSIVWHVALMYFLFIQVGVDSDWRGQGKKWAVKAFTSVKANLLYGIRRNPPAYWHVTNERKKITITKL